MKFGLTAEQFRFIAQEIVDPFHKAGFAVWVFGSRARGDHKPFSDLDLMIIGDSPERARKMIGELSEFLTKSSFPYKVDLVFYDDFAKSYQGQFAAEKAKWD